MHIVEPPAASLFMGLRVFIFKRLSLKENGRIIPLRPLERVKGSKGPTDGYLFDSVFVASHRLAFHTCLEGFSCNLGAYACIV
jgi:hypothetical protein